MKISPIAFSSLHKTYNNKISNQKTLSNPLDSRVNFSGRICNPNFYLNKPKYEYKPVASAVPINGPVGHYDNLDKFCELFANKINSMLLVPTEKDIENLIMRIQFKTKASKKTIMEVLYNLTAFSNYKAFDELSKFIKKHDIEQFGLNHFTYNSSVSGSLTNSAIDYLVAQKHFCKNGHNKIAVILDDMTLKAIENLKESTSTKDTESFDAFKEYIKNDSIIFLNLKSWNIKTKENGYKSANFLTGSGYLEDLAIETIQNLKDGQSKYDIYFSDFKKRLIELVKDDVDTDKIIFENVFPTDTKKEDIKISDILNNIKPKEITKEHIKAYLKSYLYFKKDMYKNEDEEKILSSLLKYLDEQTHAFSIDSLAIALKNLNAKITDTIKTMQGNTNNLSYILPDCRKSFAIISAMYASINNIDPKDFNYLHEVSNRNKAKTKVVLDDISASGTTERKTVCNYRVFQDDMAKIIYATVILCKKAKEFQRNGYDHPDGYAQELMINDLSIARNLILAKELPDEKDDNGKNIYESIQEKIKEDFKLLNEEDLINLFEKMDRGYDGMGLSVIFPYMIPDNCSDLASLMFKDLLYCNNTDTNKPLKYYEIKKSESQSVLYKKIDEYAKELIWSGKV